MKRHQGSVKEFTLETKVMDCLDHIVITDVITALSIKLPVNTNIKHLIYRIVDFVESLQVERDINPIVDGLKSDPYIYCCLLVIVKASARILSKIPNIEIIAAKAMTILNQARFSFSGMNLSAVRVPGADLTGMAAYQVDLSYADLSRCNFRNAYLAESNFDNAICDNIQFGEMYHLSWPTGCVTSAGFSPSGKHLIAAGDPNSIIIFDINSNSIIRTLMKHKTRVKSISIDKTGKFLISRSAGMSQGTSEYVTYLWDIESGSASVIPNQGNIAAFVPNSSSIVYVTGDLFEPKTFCYARYCENVIKYYTKILIIGSRANSRDRSDFGPIISDPKAIIASVFGDVEELKYSNDEKYLILALKLRVSYKKNSDIHEIQIWDVEKKNKINTISGHQFCLNDKFIAVASLDQSGSCVIKIYNLPAFNLNCSLENRYAADGQSISNFKNQINMQFLPTDPNILASCGSDGYVTFWRLYENDQEVITRFSAHGLAISCLAFSPDGSLLISGSGDLSLEGHTSGDRFLKLWDVKNILKSSGTPSLNLDKMYSLVFSSKKREIITGHGSGAIRRWSAQSGELIETVFVYRGESKDRSIRGMHLTCNTEKDINSERLITLNESGEVKFFNLRDNVLKKEERFFTYKKHARAFAISSDGLRMAIGGPGEILDVLDIATLRTIFFYDKAIVFSLTFSTDLNSNLLAISGQNLLTIINSFTGELIYEPSELKHNANVYYGMGVVAFSPKNVNILTSYCTFSNQENNVTQIILWDVGNKKKVCEFVGHKSVGSQLCFSPRGEYLISGSGDGEILILDIERQKELYRFMMGEIEPVAINALQFFDDHGFITSQFNGSIKAWKIHNEHNNNEVAVHLKWQIPAQVVLRSASFENTEGLSPQNQLLLNQKQAFCIMEIGLLNTKIAKGDTSQALLLIEEASISELAALDAMGYTALHWAVERNKLDLIKRLVQKWTDLIKVKNGQDVASLLFALRKGKDGFVAMKLMLESFSNGEEFKNELEGLIQAGADLYPWVNQYVVNSFRLFEAVADGNLLLVRRLVALGASVKFRECHYGCTTLIIAGGKGQLEIVKWLLENGSSVDEKNQYGATIVHAAAQQGQLMVLKWLLENKKCLANEKNGEGYTPAQIAFKCRKFETAYWLNNYILDNPELNINKNDNQNLPEKTPLEQNRASASARISSESISRSFNAVLLGKNQGKVVHHKEKKSKHAKSLMEEIELQLNYDSLCFVIKALNLQIPPSDKIKYLKFRITDLVEYLNVARDISPLVDGFNLDPQIKWCLLVIVKGSAEFLKNIFGIDKIASQAISILNAARVSFSGMDLSGICIPGADLSGAILDHTRLQEADLRGVKLQGVWLSHSNLQGAVMQDVQFGEYPFIKLDKSTKSCRFSPDGRTIAVACESSIELYDTMTHQRKRSLNGHKNWVNSIAFSPNGKLVVSGSYDKTIRLWDVENGELILKPFEGHESRVLSVAFSPDGKFLVSGSGDNTIRLWDVVSGEPVLKPFEGHTKWVNSVAFSPDGRLVVSGSEDNTIKLWDVTSGKLVLKPLEGHTRGVNSVAFSPDGKLVVSGSGDKTLRLWNVVSGEPVLKPLEGHRRSVNSIAFNPDGRFVVSGGGDNTIRLWDVSSGEPVLKPLEGHAEWVTSVAFSPDGRLVAYGNEDKTIRLWDVSNYNLISLKPTLLSPEILGACWASSSVSLRKVIL